MWTDLPAVQAVLGCSATNGPIRLRFVGNVQLEEREVLACHVAQGVSRLAEISRRRNDALTAPQCRPGNTRSYAAPAPVINQTLLIFCSSLNCYLRMLA